MDTRCNIVVLSIGAVLASLVSFGMMLAASRFIPEMAAMTSGSGGGATNLLISRSLFSKELLQRVLENGTRHCHNISTSTAYFFNLPVPENGSEVTLSTGKIHKLWMVSYDSNGNARCSGGDFYETDLSSHLWKSRPPLADIGNGSYQMELKIDDDLAGIYTLKVILLYSNFHGFDREAAPWAIDKEVLRLRIRFIAAERQASDRSILPLCSSSDLSSSTAWSGRWTRTKFDNDCKLDQDGRYRCLRDDEQCDERQCDGYLERLESNGWVYSAHCKFRLWSSTDAWQCLAGKKLFFWGDSNHRDTLQNLLNLVLNVEWDVGAYGRSFTFNVTNPTNSRQKFQLFQIFNGGPVPQQNFFGLRSMDYPDYRRLLKDQFFQGGEPDAIVLNSGLHDGHAWDSLQDFANAARNVSLFWKSLLLENNTQARVIFRNTVAVAGTVRANPSNPQKMEAFNAILSGELGDALEKLLFVDNFDMSFPWHFDHCCSDGGHYGVRPSLTKWFDGVGHFYFVDLMLIHVLLTAICF